MKTTLKIQTVRVFLISCSLFFAPQLFAAELFSIKGHVNNTQSESIKGAVVSFLNPQTFEVIATGKCKTNGDFVVEDVPEGAYIMTVKKDGCFRAKTKKIIIDKKGDALIKCIDKTDSLEYNGDLVYAGFIKTQE